MNLLNHQARLEQFFGIVDPPRKDRARELLLSLGSEDELFDLLEDEYGQFFRAQHSPTDKLSDLLSSSSNSPNNVREVEQTHTVSLPVCKYGKDCYRKNPAHFNDFAHPWLNRK